LRWWTEILKVKGVLTYDKAGLDQIEAFTRTNNTPVIALLNACSDYIIDCNQIDKVVLLNKPVNYPSILFQSEQIFSLKLPVFFRSNVKCQLKKMRKNRILVDMNGKGSSFSPLYQIIPCLNKLLNYDIYVVSDIVNLSKILNENIIVIKDREEDIEQLIEESDIVIGCGDIILNLFKDKCHEITKSFGKLVCCCFIVRDDVLSAPRSESRGRHPTKNPNN